MIKSIVVVINPWLGMKNEKLTLIREIAYATTIGFWGRVIRTVL